tara:strand:- start:51 stop:425 length:375 start_codon:yes stop_codon:yes gene_type:complete
MIQTELFGDFHSIPDGTGYKICRLCGQSKHESQFSNNGRKVAKENRCKDCRRSGMTILRDLKKTAPPKPKNCECCGEETERICLDHCHKTLKFRGWLCELCNRGIGQLGDNIEGLKRAIEYLQQ